MIVAFFLYHGRYVMVACHLMFTTNLCVLDIQQLTEWRQDVLLYDEGHLLLLATDGQVTDGPRRLLLCLELALQSTDTIIW